MTRSQKKTADFLLELLQGVDDSARLDRDRAGEVGGLGDAAYEIRLGGRHFDFIKITPLGRPYFVDQGRWLPVHPDQSQR